MDYNPTFTNNSLQPSLHQKLIPECYLRKRGLVTKNIPFNVMMPEHYSQKSFAQLIEEKNKTGSPYLIAVLKKKFYAHDREPSYMFYDGASLLEDRERLLQYTSTGHTAEKIKIVWFTLNNIRDPNLNFIGKGASKKNGSQAPDIMDFISAKCLQEENEFAHLLQSKFYLQGRIVNKDDFKAFLHAKHSVARNLPQGHYNLAMFYKKGIGTPKSDLGYSLHLGKAVEANDPFALLEIGKNCANSNDWKMALQFYLAAADHPTHPNEEASYQVAQIYAKGIIEKQDLNTAKFYYQKAANKNHAPSLVVIGAWKSRGFAGYTASWSDALPDFLKAAEQKDPDGLYYFGLCLLKMGLQSDKAQLAFQEAANRGHAEAALQLGKLCEEHKFTIPDATSPDDYKTKASQLATDYYRQAALLGSAWGSYEYGRCCIEGIGLPAPLVEEGLDHLNQAANKNISAAWYMLGNIEERNRTVEGLKKALYFYRRGMSIGVGKCASAISTFAKRNHNLLYGYSNTVNPVVALDLGEALSEWATYQYKEAEHFKKRGDIEKFKSFLPLIANTCKEAIALGNLNAKLNLALLYSKEDYPTPAPQKEIFELLLTLRNHPPAKLHLVRCYLNGYGTEKNFAEAACLLKEIVDAGHKEYRMKLIEVLIAANRHEDTAAYLGELQSEGNWEAFFTEAKLLMINYNPPQPERALQLFTVAYQNAVSSAKVWLASMNLYGLGMKSPDYAKAFELLQFVDTKDFGWSRYLLSKMYSEGLGVPQDRDKAFQLLCEAYNAGYKTAVDVIQSAQFNYTNPGFQ